MCIYSVVVPNLPKKNFTIVYEQKTPAAKGLWREKAITNLPLSVYKYLEIISCIGSEWKLYVQCAKYKQLLVLNFNFFFSAKLIVFSMKINWPKIQNYAFLCLLTYSTTCLTKRNIFQENKCWNIKWNLEFSVDFKKKR